MQAGENPTSFRRSESSDKIQRSFDRAGCRKGQAEYVSKRFRNPPREQDLAAEMEYYVSIPLYNLSDDTYEVYVRFGGELYDSGEAFTIHSRR